MSQILFKYVLRTYLFLFAGIYAGVLAIFLVADFVDRAKSYTGPHWIADVAVLYLNKAILAAYQLAPAALLLAAGATVSLFRKRGEVTAMSSVSVGPVALYAPIALSAAVICTILVAFNEYIVVKAGRRVDEIQVGRFNRWGDWASYFTPKQWFRRGERIFYLRGGTLESGFVDVTLLTVTNDFRLAERIDAARMVHLNGTRWELFEGVDRQFVGDGSVTEMKQFDRAEFDLGTAGTEFRITPGRPEQMRLGALRQQIRARKLGGLAASQFVLEVYSRIAYPVSGLPAALLAVGLALRRGRRGHLTKALVEGLLVALVLWGVMVISKTLVMAERVPAPVAAWLPTIVLIVAATGLWIQSSRGRVKTVL